MDRLHPIKYKRRWQDTKRYYRQIKYPSIPTSIEDFYIITKSGDRLDLLAEQFFNDPELWWIIPLANPNTIKRDSFSIPLGIQIRIPANHRNILEAYKQINKS